MSTQLIKPNYLVTFPPTQHHSFFRNLPPLFMMSVTIILLNILFAQLSLTYEQVQEDSLNCFTALRMQAVAIIEWRGRFRFWVGTTVTEIT